MCCHSPIPFQTACRYNRKIGQLAQEPCSQSTPHSECCNPEKCVAYTAADKHVCRPKDACNTNTNECDGISVSCPPVMPLLSLSACDTVPATNFKKVTQFR
jgi:hypothetical protein